MYLNLNFVYGIFVSATINLVVYVIFFENPKTVIEKRLLPCYIDDIDDIDDRCSNNNIYIRMNYSSQEEIDLLV